MDKTLTTAILNEIKAYDRIIIFRHKRPDGDAVGSTQGFAEILRLSYPEKDIRIINSDTSEYLSFISKENEDMTDDFYKSALGIVLDTATSARISNPRFALCDKVIKMDHHIPVEDYGAINLVEEELSSACELVAAFFANHKDELRMDKTAATYLYLGMVTDSGRFKFNSVSGDTLRLAGMLLDYGVDTETLFANLYMRDFDSFKFESHVYKKMKITENGVAYVYVDMKTQEKFGLNAEGASASVGYMDSIKDSLIWVAFIENGDGSVRVRLRSRFVTISDIAERYHGGGHACAAGATVYSKREAKKLIAELDAHLAEYKRTHEGWL